eukprot:CAMPEP_0172696236 /NCGR_PEP_ID=MMETSP1074-20121228/27912_1 /TAXON_ID=2916 /ORGANISM="Ceratium fusus, Strain PA161109" /LENGTH=681 /DNA_ID=CAMNT_0013516955 /DNA_START=208 /DNA_END=2253 /DNA_ORIENTATION=+
MVQVTAKLTPLSLIATAQAGVSTGPQATFEGPNSGGQSNSLLAKWRGPGTLRYAEEEGAQAAAAFTSLDDIALLGAGLTRTTAGLLVGLAAVVGIAIGVAVAACVWKKKTEVVAQPGEELTLDASTEAPAASKEEESADYDQLLRQAAQRVAETVGPKLAKGHAVRDTLENRFYGLKDRAKAFFLNEFNFTAGTILKAVEAEENALVLDWNQTVSSNLPSASVLLAGALSPTLLSLRKVTHLVLLLLGPLPILVLTVWAVVHDWGTKCAIPSIYAWSYVQGVLAVFLFFGHLIMYLKVSSGLRIMNAKAEVMAKRLSNLGNAQDGGLSGTREFFVCSTVLLQHALLVEDSVRSGFWTHLTGLSSVFWIVVMVWDYVIVIGWTFWPGIIAFNPKVAQAAPDAYCGARVTVFVARLSCVLHLIFFLVTLIATANWLSSLFVNRPGYGRSMLEWAVKMDEGILGIPVAQTLVKAFVLGGGSELTSAKLAVAMHDRLHLERQRSEAQNKLDALDCQMRACSAQEEALRETAGSDQAADILACINSLEAVGDKDVNEWKQQGRDIIKEMQEKSAVGVEEGSTKELEAMMQKIQELLSVVQDSEVYQSAVSKAQAAADAAAQGASQAAASVGGAEGLQAAFEQAQHAAETTLQRAQEAAGQLESSEAVRGALAQAQEAASSAAGRAT